MWLQIPNLDLLLLHTVLLSLNVIRGFVDCLNSPQ